MDKEQYKKYMEQSLLACEAINELIGCLPLEDRQSYASQLESAMLILDKVQRGITKTYLEDGTK